MMGHSVDRISIGKELNLVHFPIVPLSNAYFLNILAQVPLLVPGVEGPPPL